MLELKEQVFEANLELVKRNLVLFTWGSASAIDRAKGVLAIKPTGILYEDMRPGDMVLVDIQGNVIDGKLNPSFDLPIHLALYKHFSRIGGIVHTRSTAATSWAQAGKSIPVLGTTHSDYFNGEIPCTRKLNDNEIKGNYEEETAKAIIERFTDIKPMEIPAVLVCSRGPIAWGNTVHTAVRNAIVLEAIAQMAINTGIINPTFPIQKELQSKHYLRRHSEGL